MIRDWREARNMVEEEKWPTMRPNRGRVRGLSGLVLGQRPKDQATATAAQDGFGVRLTGRLDRPIQGYHRTVP